MKLPRLLLPLALSIAAGGTAQAATPVLVIHGGAGAMPAKMDGERRAAVREALHNALRQGQAALSAGRPAMDAVIAAITTLEDSPCFNAGRGAVFTHEGRNELDASIMDGATRRAGAVAGVTRIRNPIMLARGVMERSPHVMLSGAGAEAFAQSIGMGLVDPAYFRTEERWQQLQKALENDKRAAIGAHGADHFGTVGAVALDAQGRLAAGTSTGGMTNKRWGRVGDSPVIGAGTYADAGCAVSGTGWGEYYLRTVAAYRICVHVTELGQSVAHASDAVINQEIPKLGGDGGAIVLAADGRFATPFNTEGMFRGWVRGDAAPQVAMGRDDGGTPLAPRPVP
jgi:beta-aspartyl-peptidase (threonine type)